MTTARNAHIVFEALPGDGSPIPFIDLARKIAGIRESGDGLNLQRHATLHQALISLKRGGLADVCYGRGWYRTGQRNTPRPSDGYLPGGPPASPAWGGP